MLFKGLFAINRLAHSLGESYKEDSKNRRKESKKQRMERELRQLRARDKHWDFMLIMMTAGSLAIAIAATLTAGSSCSVSYDEGFRDGIKHILSIINKAEE